MRRIVLIVASVLVSALFLYLSLRNIPLENIGASLQQANLGWVALALITMSFGLLTRAIRWQGLLDGKIRLLPAFHILNTGFLLNNLPLRAGEFARMLLATKEKVPFPTAATSVVFERLIDTLLVVIALVIAIARIPNAPEGIITSTRAFGAAVVVAFIVLIAFARYPMAGHRVIQYAQQFLPFLKRLPLERLLDNVLDGLKPLTHWRSGLQAVFWTLISWAISWTTVYCCVRALGIETSGVDLWLLSALALTLASFSIAIPLSLASIGPFQGAVILAAQAVGLWGNQQFEAMAGALSFLFHGVNVMGYFVWGGLALLVMGVSLGEIIAGKANSGDQPAPAPEAGA